MKSLKVTIGGTDASPTATLADATFTDIFTTTISTTEAVTGIYGMIQKLGLVGLGMVVQNKRLGNGFNPFQSS